MHDALGSKAVEERTEGAVAPTIALSLSALIAVGGIAFDYARMASLDTELQDARPTRRRSPPQASSTKRTPMEARSLAPPLPRSSMLTNRT